MRVHAIGFLLAGVFVSTPLFAAMYAPPPGYHTTRQSFAGDVFAVAPNGEVAIGIQSDPTIRVYASAAAAQANDLPIDQWTITGAKFWGDLTFADNDTLLISEDKGINGVLSASLSGGMPTLLGNVPAVQGIAVHSGNVYAVAVNGPGTNAVYQVGNPTPILSNIGTGYLGGIAFDSAGNMLLTDTNDPDFVGNAGKILRFDSTLSPLPSIDLSGGGGSGAFDLALDTEGDIFASTNNTITEVPHGTTLAEQFGSAFSDSPSFGFTFITGLDFSGNGFTNASDTGTLWINATDSEDGAIIGVQTPEPTSLALIAIVVIPLFLKRRRVAMSVAASLAVFATISIAPRNALADQFFATQVVSTVVGTQQQTGFTNPNLALGGPHGGGLDAGSTDVYTLGNGGSIILGFDDSNPNSHRYIDDGPGPDFIVSENPFYQAEDPHRSFAELMFVEVSSDGTNFQRFTNYSTTPSPVPFNGVIDPDNVAGFAGVNPVLADVEDASQGDPGNGIDPFQVGAAGGDVFDLHSLIDTPLVQSGVVDLQHIRYVRLVDVIGDGSTFDSFGRPVYDPTGFGIGGADVDSLTVINGFHAPEPTIAPVFVLLNLARRVRRPI